jgi:hypothetical protein
MSSSVLVAAGLIGVALAAAVSKRIRESGILKTMDTIGQHALLARRFPALLVDLGWPPFWDISLHDAANLVQRRDAFGLASTRPEVESLVLSLFDDDRVVAMLAGWEKRPFIQPRLPILEAGVAAHLRRDYACSVPALLPQIEGIVADYFGRIRPLDVRNQEAQATMLLGARGKGKMLRDAMDRSMLRFYLDVVLASVGRRDELPLTLSRHAILHGRDVRYATRQKSLQTLLMVDYLLDSFAIVTVRGSTVYHASTCPVLGRAKGRIDCRQDLSRSALAGLKPCKVCSPPRAT